MTGRAEPILVGVDGVGVDEAEDVTGEVGGFWGVGASGPADEVTAKVANVESEKDKAE